MARWPRDNQADLIKFYGNPGAKSFYSDNLVKVFPPFNMKYDGKPMPYFMFHRKAAPAISRALDAIWEHVVRDQSILDREGVSDCAGTYNPRFVRGSKSKWSNHAYASAIDLDAKANGLGQEGDMPRYVIAAFKKEGFRWGGDYKGRKDPMHFEAVWNGEDEIAYAADVTMTVAEAKEILSGGYDSSAAVAAFDHHIERKPGFFRRVATWIKAGATAVGFGGVGYLTDWQVAVALFVFIALLIAVAIGLVFWLFDAPEVRAWIRKQVT